MATTTYDIFGDIHGQYLRLTRVLENLGYAKKNGLYRKKGHKMIFVGDLIDRGVNSAKVLELVKNHVEAGLAELIIGNHEYNLWGYCNSDSKGNFYRPHLAKNERQVVNTLKSYKGKKKMLTKHLEFIETLPVYINKKSFRAVHACWDKEAIKYLKSNYGKRLSPLTLQKSFGGDKELKRSLKLLLSGPEIELPPGLEFYDSDGNPRSKYRYKWWEETEGKNYRKVAVKPNPKIPKKKVKLQLKDRSYADHKKPLFVGHYSMRGEPELLLPNMACVDWVKRRNRIVVYRFSKEQVLSEKNLVYFY